MKRLDWSQVLTPAIAAALVGILGLFAHAGLYGERGLSALNEAEATEAALIQQLAQLESERRALANRTRRLGEDYLDLDLLDERARSVLGYRRTDEVVLR